MYVKGKDCEHQHKQIIAKEHAYVKSYLVPKDFILVRLIWTNGNIQLWILQKMIRQSKSDSKLWCKTDNNCDTKSQTIK